MNKRLFWLMYGFANKNEGITKCAVALAKWSQRFFVLIYIVGFVYLIFNDLTYLPRYTLVPLIALCYNSFIRKKLNRKRPFMELDIESLIRHDESGSCPSNHAASAMVIAMAIFKINPICGAIVFCIAILTGVSRILVGVHYPLDVLFGWLIGASIGLVGCNLFL